MFDFLADPMYWFGAASGGTVVYMARPTISKGYHWIRDYIRKLKC